MMRQQVDVQNILPIKIEQGELKIPLHNLRLSRQTILEQKKN